MRLLNLSKTLGELSQIRQICQKKKLFLRGDFTPFMSKSFQIWDHFFPLFLHKDSKYLKSWDIGHWEVGARRRLTKWTNKKKNLSRTCFATAALGQFWANMFKYETTSYSPMSKLLRYLESLRKSNGKKWSHIWKLLLIKGVKSPRTIFFFSLANLVNLAKFTKCFRQVQQVHALK